MSLAFAKCKQSRYSSWLVANPPVPVIIRVKGRLFIHSINIYFVSCPFGPFGGRCHFSYTRYPPNGRLHLLRDGKNCPVICWSILHSSSLSAPRWVGYATISTKSTVLSLFASCPGFPLYPSGSGCEIRFSPKVKPFLAGHESASIHIG